MMNIKGRDTVAILRRDYSDEITEFGETIPDNTELEVPNVLIGWGSSADKLTNISESIENSATLFFPRGTVTKHDDRYRLPDGSIWIKDGATINWTTQRGGKIKPRPIVEIKRAEG